LEKRKRLKWEKWGRAGKHFIETVNGKQYIRPIPESGYIYYDFSILQDDKSGKRANQNYIVLAILNLDTSNNKEILKFVDRFGLLGILQYKYLEPRYAFIDDKYISYMPERNGPALCPTKEIEKNYLVDLTTFSDSFYSIGETLSEPLDEFIDAINIFKSLGNYVYSIKKAEMGISGPLRALVSKDFSDIANKDIDVQIRSAIIHLQISLTDSDLSMTRVFGSLEEIWEPYWCFASLLSAAYHFFIQDMSGHYRLDVCPRCSKLFLSAVSTRIFCSRKCEDATRKADSRKKDKEGK
jgi:hypothetical protein